MWFVCLANDKTFCRFWETSAEQRCQRWRCRRINPRTSMLLTTAVRAVLEVDLKHAREQPDPTNARRPAVRAAWLGRGELRLAGDLLGAVRHHQCPQLRVGRQHPMESDQVQPRSRHQRGQPLHELKRAHHDVGGAVAPGGLEFEHHLPGAVDLYAFIGHCGSGDGAAQLFQPLALAGIAARRRVLRCSPAGRHTDPGRAQRRVASRLAR